VIIVGEKGTEHAVDETCSENLVVGSSALTFEEATGEATY
jgi:hypothetical protein